MNTATARRTRKKKPALTAADVRSIVKLRRMNAAALENSNQWSISLGMQANTTRKAELVPGLRQASKWLRETADYCEAQIAAWDNLLEGKRRP